jgi:hypothetical protein
MYCISPPGADAIVIAVACEVLASNGGLVPLVTAGTEIVGERSMRARAFADEMSPEEVPGREPPDPDKSNSARSAVGWSLQSSMTERRRD